jgi:hypothetical protein
MREQVIAISASTLHRLRRTSLAISDPLDTHKLVRSQIHTSVGLSEKEPDMPGKLTLVHQLHRPFWCGIEVHAG